MGTKQELVLVDTNIFVIDLRYRRDRHFKKNQSFLYSVAQIGNGFIHFFRMASMEQSPVMIGAGELRVVFDAFGIGVDGAVQIFGKACKARLFIPIARIQRIYRFTVGFPVFRLSRGGRKTFVNPFYF